MKITFPTFLPTRTSAYSFFSLSDFCFVLTIFSYLPLALFSMPVVMTATTRNRRKANSILNRDRFIFNSRAIEGFNLGRQLSELQLQKNLTLISTCIFYISNGYTPTLYPLVGPPRLLSSGQSEPFGTWLCVLILYSQRTTGRRCTSSAAD